MAGPDDLIPVPQQVERRDGTFDTRGRAWFADAASRTHAAVRHKLRFELRVRPSTGSALGAHTVCVGAPSAGQVEPPEQPQGYALDVRPEALVLRGRDADGLYWGLVSLEQLLEDGPELPCCRIVDWPSFALRGHHDDISRKQVSTADDLRRIVRLLSRFKLNVYTPYMEDMLFLKSHPDIGKGRGRLMPDEVAAMHEEAERHNVIIMPTYSLIGHQENLLADPSYARLGRKVFQPMSSLDVRKPEVREFLADVIDDVCELFPGPYFHGGFDETQGIGAEEFLDHANWCARRLKERGKQMPMWVDMIYNHFGHEMVRRLEDNAIPVDWQYGCTDRVPQLRELAEQGRPVWGLAGYGNGGTHLPDFGRGRDNIDCWVRDGIEVGIPALFCSQWGDHGYENHRDMCWNQFAYLGEGTWSGPRARRGDFERRFQLSFYGAELPELTPIVERLPSELSMKVRDYWRHFRANAFANVRWAASSPEAGPGLEEDERRLTDALGAVERCRPLARREAEHLEHFRVALLRVLSVVRRLRFGLDYLDPERRGDVAVRVGGLRRELQMTREAYVADWLRTNKKPNIEVSLKVYEEVLESYGDLLEARAGEQGPRDGFTVLDLSEHYNQNFLPVAGLPLGERVVDGVPFLFAGERHTHAAFSMDSPPVELAFAEQSVSDVHLVVAAHKTTDEPHPGLRVELLRGGEPVFREELLNITDLCDWWAPLGEHIWAGGGMAYVDPERVRYALKPGHMYGLARTFRFEIPEGLAADALRLTALGEEEIRLFAATLES